jgi:hypothetical protein
MRGLGPIVERVTCRGDSMGVTATLGGGLPSAVLTLVRTPG